MTQNRPKVAIIGCGRLGSALAIAMHHKKYRIAELIDKRFLSAKRLAGMVNAETYSDKIQDLKAAEIVFIAVPDDAIVPVVSELATWLVATNEMKFLYHTSGTLTSAVFDSLRNYQIAVASVHPIQTFPGSVDDWKRFENCYFGIEGDKTAIELFDTIFKKLGSKSITIPREFKSHYHLACTIASNFLVALMTPVTALFQKGNFSEQQVFEILSPLITTTLANLKNDGSEAALSGPILRGDTSTIERHLQILSKELPSYVSLYQFMAKILLEFNTVKENLTKEQYESLTQLLRTVN
jgi:predicted short-subunit dehydrogenase-like oxidoreductase (DUF2520 family)